jgi:hypothetical protein
MFGRCRSCRKFRVLHSVHIVEDVSDMNPKPPSVRVRIIVDACRKCRDRMATTAREELKRGHN